MQSDWGGEYEKLNSFFTRIGITHHVSCPHTHQQNGFTERKHRHIVDVGLAILAHVSIPLKFWDDVFHAAIYLINRTPNHVIQYQTPLERLLHIKPDYSFLHTFGCAYWPNIQPNNSKKFQYRSTQCVLLGYSSIHKGFKCLKPNLEEFTSQWMSFLMRAYFLLKSLMLMQFGTSKQRLTSLIQHC
jgi:hypothetical protein